LPLKSKNWEIVYFCAMIKTETEAIIFDLGGVLINLDYQLTSKAFIDLGLTDFDATYSQLQQTDLFDRFETGAISSFHFINRLLDQLPQGTSGNKVVHAWNAMILDFPEERLLWLLEMKQRYRIFLLSNTNTLHMEAVCRSLERTIGHQRLEDYFEHVYLSCEMGLRKPNPEIFSRVCDEQRLNPATTVFIDDTLQHVEGAASIGLQALHLKPGEAVQSLFS
jgi:glucose-1-phosphatase